ncbi:MAG TPA: ABC transporter ATP-binding protein, partial [Dermatophilaceae bacterium]|nr:ABC transporter ATP-binding protein [Dermatophilaceae bacterium]HRC65556.1 ABC transporter ATP-binding protein [Dermatophilaceae bacterium]
ASSGALGGGSGDAGPTQIQQREARKEMARIERALTRLAEREDRVHAQMAKEATDHLAVLRLNGDLRAIVDERDDLEMAWLAAAEIVG